MASIKNLHLYGTPEQVKAWKEEQDFIGRNVSQIDPKNPGHLIVFALPPRKVKKKKVEETTEKQARNKRGNGYNRHKEISEGA